MTQKNNGINIAAITDILEKYLCYSIMKHIWENMEITKNTYFPKVRIEDCATYISEGSLDIIKKASANSGITELLRHTEKLLNKAEDNLVYCMLKSEEGDLVELMEKAGNHAAFRESLIRRAKMICEPEPDMNPACNLAGLDFLDFGGGLNVAVDKP